MTWYPHHFILYLIDNIVYTVTYVLVKLKRLGDYQIYIKDVLLIVYTSINLLEEENKTCTWINKK